MKLENIEKESLKQTPELFLTKVNLGKGCVGCYREAKEAVETFELTIILIPTAMTSHCFCNYHSKGYWANYY